MEQHMTATVSTYDAESLRVEPATGKVAKRRYIDREFADLEQRQLWRRVWQWACLLEDVAQVGDFYEYQYADQSVLILRGADGALRAFHNVCPHRGNRLRTGTGTLPDELACNYHRWTWDLRGRLIKVPEREGFPAFDDACFALRQVKVDVWGQFVFINPDPDAEPLHEYLAPLPERVAGYHWEEHTRTSSVTLPMAANWKTMVDGFLDVYHLQGVHPQLLEYTDDVHTTYEQLGKHSAMYMPMGVPSPKARDTSEQGMLNELSKPRSGIMGKMLRESAAFEMVDGVPTLKGGITVREALIEAGRASAAKLDRDYSALTDEQLIDDHHYFFFPNVIVNAFAGHIVLARMRPDAAAPERCFFDLFVMNWLTDSERLTREPSPHELVAENTKVGRVPDQDFTALPKVQLGLHSDGLEEIFLSTHGQEVRVADFHSVLDSYLYDD